MLVIGVSNHYGYFKFNPLKKIIIIQVNDHKMYVNEFSEKLAWALKQYDVLLAKDTKIIEFNKNKILDEFIHQSILLDWAQANHVSLSAEDLDTALFEIRKSYPDDISFQQALSDSGQTLSQYKEQLKTSLLQKRVFEVLASQLVPPEQKELLDYYEKNKSLFVQKPLVRLRQIVFEKEEAALQLYHSLTPSSNIAELAKKFSIAPEAKKGGDTGWIEKGTLEIFDKAFNMRVGQRSNVEKSPYGFHVFEVLDKKPEAKLSFEQAKDAITKQLAGTSEQTLYSDWLENQVRSARVLKNMEALQSLRVHALGE